MVFEARLSKKIENGEARNGKLVLDSLE